MYHCPLDIDNIIPGEYRAIAESLFPHGGFSSGQELEPDAAAGFADALGIGADYRRLIAIGKNSAQMHTFLYHFQNNLDLLIQKTWVEKDDVSRKERLQDEVPFFMTLIEQGKFQQALDKFGAILEELTYLFFGAQSTKDDFAEYTFRIDAQMGLFWWYGGRLAVLKDTGTGMDVESLWAVLLIGICYLTNF